MTTPPQFTAIQIGAAVFAGGLALMMHQWFMGIEHPRRRLLTLATWVALAWAASLPGIVMGVFQPLRTLAGAALWTSLLLAMVELRIWLIGKQTEWQLRSRVRWAAEQRAARYRATDFPGDGSR